MGRSALPSTRRRPRGALVATAVLAVGLLAAAPLSAPAAAAEETPVLYRAVNLNGPATTVGGVPFEAGTAPGVTAGPRAFCNQNVPLVPATDAATAAMLRCSVWGSGTPGAQVSMTGMPVGTYQVGLYVWEDNYSQTFRVLMNGSTVATVVSGPGGSWQLLGPFEVAVTDGTLAITTSGGSANLSGLVVHGGTGTPPPPPPVNRAPVVTAPASQASTVGSAIAPLQVAASDPDSGQSLTFAATGLPAGLSMTAAGLITGTPTTAGTSSVTITATDDGAPPLAGSAAFSWVVTAPGPDPDPDPDPEPGLYRAVNLNGPAVVAGGIAFEAGTAAGVTAGPKSFCKQTVPLVPVTDAGTATMLRCSVWGSGNPGAQVSMTGMPTGTYQVGLYVWEDNFSATFGLSMNGRVVAPRVVSGSAGAWQLLGPFEVPVTDGTLAITTSGGSANLSGLVVSTGTGTPPPPVNRPPSVTAPAAQASVVGTAIAPLQVAASDPDPGQSLAFAASGLPAGLSMSATGLVTGTPTTAGTSSVTVTATDDGAPPLAASASFSWVVTAPGPDPDPDPDPQPGVYRAVNLNGPAITVGDVAFEAGATAPGVTSGPNAFCKQSVGLVPATDVATATMVRCSVWGSGTPGSRVTMTGIPAGTYQVSLYTWEDNAAQSFSVLVNGDVVAATVASGPGGTWQILGPYEVTITDGTLAITTSGGSANLSGLVVGTGAVTPSGPRATFTAPASGAVVTAPVTITGTASDAAGIAGVDVRIRDTTSGRFWNGTDFQLDPTQVAAALTNPGGASTGWSYEFAPSSSSAQPYEVTATPRATGGVAGAPASIIFTVSGGAGGIGLDPTKVTDAFVAGGNWTKALAADWLADGTMLVLTEGGRVYRVNTATGAQSLELDITAKVFSEGEAGALDILVDTAGTGYYIYYTVAGSDRLRISHFTVGSSAEQVLWTNSGLGYNTAHAVHLGGSLNIGPDGKLYLTVGDRYDGRSQDLTNVFGKVLRINTDGTIPADNPFYDGAGPRADEIWAYGFRNPYRANFDDTTGIFWVGDVGGNVDSTAYEEVNIVEAGRNYGWPTCEGPVGAPKNGPLCPAGVTGPVYTYPHAIGAGCCQNRAIVGGEIYRGSVFPLTGHYVYSDYAADTFAWVEIGPDGRSAGSSGLLRQVATSATPVWLGVGPDGHIYWLSLGFTGNGQLRRLGYTGAVNRPPVITTASATPTTGAAPLAVSFTGAGSDPDGTAVSYAWTFGDGATSTAASPTHTYAAAGTYQARLVVTSGGASVSSDLITVVVGAAPTATITGPADGTVFEAGDTITIQGTGSDPDTGPLSSSALSWDIQFLHNDHAHPVLTGSGPSIALTVPTTGHDFTGDTRYRVTLTATDPDGLTGTTSIVLRPSKTTVAISSNQATTATVDAVTQPLPYTLDTVVGFEHTLEVPESRCVDGRLWTFQSWSDGGARAHAVTVVPGLALVATYADTGACAPPG